MPASERWRLKKLMIMEQRPILSNNEKVALLNGGETTSRVMTLDGTTADDVIRQRNAEKFNDQVDMYVEKFEKHSTNLKEFAERVNENVQKIEIMPIGSYLLIKTFEENPFQRIVKDSKSGLILDLGGQHPQYKNTDNGKIEEEENIVKVGVIQECGPECRYCRPGDTVFATKMSLVPVPFYKQGLQLLNETRVLAVVNEGLTERFNEIKNEENAEFIDINELPEFLGDTIEERIKGYEMWKKQGYKLIAKSNA